MHYLQELPLAFFTLMTQMAVGIVLVGRFMAFFTSDPKTLAVLRRQNIVSLILVAVAAFISLAHTGTPLHGPFTLLGIGSSWLSREIAVLGLTGAAMLWLAWMSLKKERNPREGLASALVVIFGLLLVYTVSQVYNRSFIPGWNTPGVLPLFLGSAFMLGAAWNLMSISFAGGKESAVANSALLWVVLGYAAMALGIPLAMSSLLVAGNPSTYAMAQNQLPCAHALHAAVSGIGLMVLVCSGLRAASGKGLNPLLGIAGFVILFAGELVGRMVFYLSYFRLGM